MLTPYLYNYVKDNNIWYNIIHGQKGIAMSKKKVFLNKDELHCIWRNGYKTCSGFGILRRKEPSTCAEYLILDDGMTVEKCMKEFRIITEPRQDYHMNHDGIITLFSYENDTVKVNCGRNKTVQRIEKGYSKLVIGGDCSVETRELIIKAPAKAPKIINIHRSIESITGEFSQLEADIEFHVKIDIDKMEQDVVKYAESELKVESSIIETVDSMKKFDKIKEMAEYHPLKISLEDPLSMSNTLTFASAGTILCVVAVSIIACMLCCSPCRTCCSCCCEGMIKSLSCCCKLICFTRKIVRTSNESTTPIKDNKKSKKRVLSDSYLCNSLVDDVLELSEYKTPPKKRKTVRFPNEESPWVIENLGTVPTLIKRFNGELFTFNLTDMTIRDENGVKNEVIAMPDFRKTLELRLRNEFSGARRKLSTDKE
jgi:hypothetical protein